MGAVRCGWMGRFGWGGAVREHAPYWVPSQSGAWHPWGQARRFGWEGAVRGTRGGTEVVPTRGTQDGAVGGGQVVVAGGEGGCRAFSPPHGLCGFAATFRLQLLPDGALPLRWGAVALRADGAVRLGMDGSRACSLLGPFPIRSMAPVTPDTPGRERWGRRDGIDGFAEHAQRGPRAHWAWHPTLILSNREHGTLRVIHGGAAVRVIHGGGAVRLGRGGSWNMPTMGTPSPIEGMAPSGLYTAAGRFG
jgi:hypothetical protein